MALNRRGFFSALPALAAAPVMAIAGQSPKPKQARVVLSGGTLAGSRVEVVGDVAIEVRDGALVTGCDIHGNTRG